MSESICVRMSIGGARGSSEAAQPEYTGLIASTWDLLRGDTSGWSDRAFYRRLIEQSGQPVLDVGCGTGRLLLDYLAQGVDIDGVDVSPEMLAICRRRAEASNLHPNLYEQRMEELDLPRRYRTIIVPSSSFQLVIEPHGADQAMRCFHKHLEPGGVLVMPFIVLGGSAAEAGESSEKEVVREDGAIVRRRSFARYDPATQLEHTDDTFEVFIDGQVVASERHVRSPATRGYTPAQARALFEAAGFAIEKVLSEFTDSLFRDGDKIFTVVARREVSLGRG